MYVLTIIGLISLLSGCAHVLQSKVVGVDVLGSDMFVGSQYTVLVNCLIDWIELDCIYRYCSVLCYVIVLQRSLST